MSGPNSILFVDAYDSFSNNIVALLYDCIPSADITIVRIDTDIEKEFCTNIDSFIQCFRAIVLGPGPGHPANNADVGLFDDVWRCAELSRIPVLGICLGFQSLCVRNGYAISRMHMPCHGQTKRITAMNRDIFMGLGEINAMNYNSLAVQTREFAIDTEHSRPSSSGTNSSTSSASSDFIEITSQTHTRTGKLQLLAYDDDGYAMAVRHAILPFWGFQFHPESCMSRGCKELIEKWWITANEHNTIFGRLELAAIPHHHLKNIPRRTTASVQNMPDRRVVWDIMKMKNLNPSKLSDLCYDAASNNATVMLESTAKGRFSIYAFTDTSTERLIYHQGVLTTLVTEQVASTERMSYEDVLRTLERKTKASASCGGCPRVPFWGGFIGYMSYEMNLDTINISSGNQRKVPDMNFVFVDRSVVYDNRTTDVCIQSIRPDDEKWVREMQGKIRKLEKSAARVPVHQNLDMKRILRSSEVILPCHETYTSRIRQCHDNLFAGQSYELCLTGEATVVAANNSPDTSYRLYQNLRKHNPVPYASYLHFPSLPQVPGIGTTILSSSPELFLAQSRTGTMDMIPMKGTVQRGANVTIEDAMKVLYTPKETAENLMIADLIQHDLHAVVGSKPFPYFTQSPNPASKAVYDVPPQPLQRNPSDVEDDQNGRSSHIDLRSHQRQHLHRPPLSICALNTIQTYDTVYQLTSHIRAHPPPHISTSTSPTKTADIISHNHSALHHVLPPGSMTGAPKKRSCEILETLEQRTRGVYSGVIGYMDVGGGSCWSVAIRTAFAVESEDYEIPTQKPGDDNDDSSDGDNEWQEIEMSKRRIWHVGAGGAITVLSDVEAEWEEMMGKLKNVLKGFTKE